MDADGGKYAAQIDLDNDNDSHVLMVRLVGGGKRVLDVGCWTGDMAVYLAAQNTEVVGIERDEQAANGAAERIAQGVVGDVEQVDLLDALGPKPFDVVVFGDVLEHLVDPAATLRRMRPVLAPGGYVVASVPNVAHGSVRLRLLEGNFRYTDVGLLDRTHLRFFTRETLHELFEEAGFAVVETRETTIDPLLAPEAPLTDAGLDPAVVDQVRADPEAHVYQFVVKAVPDDAHHAIRQLYRRERQLTESVNRLRRTAPFRDDANDTGLVQLSVVGVGRDAPTAWCLALLEREVDRRMPGATVLVLSSEDRSPVHLRWSDAVVSAGGHQLPDELTRDGAALTLDVGIHPIAGIDQDAEMAAPLFGLALLAGRALKDDGSTAQLPMLRVLEAVPAEGEYLVVAVEGEVADRDGLVTVVRRLAEDGVGVVVLPLGRPNAGPMSPDELAGAGLGQVTVMPHDASFESVLALLDGAHGVITTDDTTAVLALVLGRSHALLADGGAPGTFLSALGGGVAATTDAIEGALQRTQGGATEPARLGPLQARVDDALDALVESLVALDHVGPHPQPAPADANYVAVLEATVASLQRRAVAERARIARVFDKLHSDALMDEQGRARQALWQAKFEAFESTAENYREAIVELQELLHQATRPEPTPRPPAGSRLRPRRVAAGIARRLGLRRQ
ncbi:MAG: hypothetical protein QOF60_1193 [Actinomycetota bacterium]|nr:hypothetical protein [Actinomycetota bacterium]